jgi:hypothetical protein
MSDEIIFPKKWAKIIKELPEFTDIIESAGTKELKKIIIECEDHLYTIEKEKEGDVKLNSAKELVKEYSAPYRDSMNVQTAKIKYIMHILEKRGISLNNED